MRRSIAIYAFILAAAGLAVYANSLGNGFCYDENIVILGNDLVQEDGRFMDILRGAYWGSGPGRRETESWGYRPLTILSYYLIRKLAGNDPFPHHLTNVLLHVGVTLLLFLLLVRMGLAPLPSALAAGIFTVHAVHTEAVAQIVGRAELIAAFFLLAALLLHLETRGGGARRRLLAATAAALAAFLGLLGKESAAVFAAAAFCVDLYRDGGEGGPGSVLARIVKQRWKVYLAYLVPVVVFLVLRGVLFGRPMPTFDVHFVDNPLRLLPPLLRPLAAVAVFGKALLLFVLPVRLSPEYGYDQIPVERFYALGTFYFGLASLIGITVLVFRYRKAAPAVFFGWILLVVAYFPVSNVPFLIHTILGERILYIPSIGFCVMLAFLLFHAGRSGLPRAGTASVIAGACLLLFHAVRTPLANRIWRSDLTLFASAVKTSGRSVRVLNNHGNVLLLRGDIEGAERSYREALEIFPAYDDAAVNLAGLLSRKGEIEEAAALLEEVLARNPGHETAGKSYRMIRELLERDGQGKAQRDAATQGSRAP